MGTALRRLIRGVAGAGRSRTAWWAAAILVSSLWLATAERQKQGVGGDAECYFAASARIAAGDSPYDWSGASYTYVYPPLLAIALVPTLAADPGSVAVAWNGFLRVSAVALLVLAVVLAGLAGTGPGLLAFGLLWSEPVMIGLHFGNLSIPLALSVVLAAAAWRRAPALSGLAIGLGAAVKVVPLVAIPYLATRALRGDGGARVALVAACAVLAGSALLPWNLEYLEFGAWQARLGSSAGSNFAWGAILGIGPALPFALAAGMAALLGMRTEPGADGRTDWAILSALMLAATPRVCSPMFALAILPTLTLAGLSWRRERVGPAFLLAVAAAAALVQAEHFYDREPWALRVLLPAVAMSLPLAVSAAILRLGVVTRGVEDPGGRRARRTRAGTDWPRAG